MHSIRRALRFFQPEGARLVGVFLLLLLATLANLLKPWPIAVLVDGVLQAKPRSDAISQWLASHEVSTQVLLLASTTLLLHVLQAVLSAWQSHLLIGVGLSGLARVREAVFRHLLQLAPSYYQRQRAGDLIYRAAWDTYAFQTLFQHGLFGFSQAALSLALMVAVMAQVHLPLTLAALVTVPVVLSAMVVLSRRMGARSLLAHAADSQVTSSVQQAISALPLVQSCQREADEAVRYGQRVREAYQARRAQHGLEVAYLALLGVLFGLGTALILWLGAQAVQTGHLSIGTLLVFLAYLGQFYEPLQQLSRVGTILSDAGAGTRRVLELLDSPEVVREHPTPQSLPRFGTSSNQAGQPELRRGVSWSAATFSYGAAPVVHDLDLHIRPGEYIALVGPSGAGKTTLLLSLLRFHDPTSGSVQWDGIDLRELALSDLRAGVGLVLQEPIILPASVAENVGYGRPGASRAQIQEACGWAGAARFVERLPQGYDTLLGDGAARLSVGERQRLSLARAFLHQAPVLLLDEPTSALDAESESAVAASLNRLRQGRTTVMVAHRAGSLAKPDRVIYLAAGRIRAMGTPAEVAAAEPAFAQAFAAWL